MKKLEGILLSALMLISASSCTQNNGDISPWFGIWRMTSLLINGEPSPDYTPGSITWSFQGEIIEIITTGDYHDYSQSVGMWTEDSGNLLLDFTHADGQGNYEYMYTPPAVLEISGSEPALFNIAADYGGREMRLDRILESGETMTVNLKKIY